MDDAEKAQVLSRLDRINHLINELERMVATTADRQRIRDRMRREVDAAKEAVRILGTHD
jgi:tRNA C32,U32 (ribose-2'-O)-methylase TrmJ